MSTRILPVLANERHEFFCPLVEALEKFRGTELVVRFGFAYVSLSGVHQLLEAIRTHGKWDSVRKEFLIGVHHAISEPSALDCLRNVPNSTVRAFLPSGQLNADACVATPLFHPKVITVSDLVSGRIRLLQAGSANLTASAVREFPANHELSLAWLGNAGKILDDEPSFISWWNELWVQAREVNRAFIRKYAELRRKVFDANPILRSVTDASDLIEQAEYLFLDVGAGSGPPDRRHQVEFPESLVRFFGIPRRARRDLTLVRGVRSWEGRPLSFKRTTYGVEIWRLGMPTQTTGGDPISHRAIRFRRTDSCDEFEFEVVDIGTHDYLEWERLANLNGHLGSTCGSRPRRFGFYNVNMACRRQKT